MSATDKVAKIISDLTKQISSKTRAAQLGNSSVRILTGDELLIGDAVETATDTSADLGSLMDYTEGVSDIADGDANNLTLVPEWLVGVGDTGDLAFSVAAEAGERVTVALEEADKAAQDAANALTTANGKNARRRGKNQPEPPTGGWAQGDQWIRDDENGKPVEVLVWSGTTFVSEQLLASELLVIGANGTVQIKDGLITAPKLAVDALDFKVARGLEIQGGKIIGGEFVLGNVTSTQEVYSDSCSSVARWWGRFQSQTQTTEVQLSPISQSGTSVTNIATAGLKYIPTAVNSGSDFEAWVRVTAEQEVFVRIGGYQVSIGVVPANTWKKISLKFIETTAQNITIYGTDPFGSLIYVDDIKLTKQVVQNNSGARLYRDSTGKAILETISANTRTRLIDGAVQIDNPASPSSARISLSSLGLSSNDSVSRITINKDSDSIGTGIDLFAGQGSGISLDGGKTTGKATIRGAAGVDVSGILNAQHGFEAIETTDWNTATETGYYYSMAAANGPNGTSWFAGTVVNHRGANHILQEVREARATTHDTVHRRYWNGSSWTPWVTDGDRDLFVRRSITGLTWPGSGSGWYWTPPIKVNFPAGKFSKRPYMGTPHVFSEGFLMFSMVTGITATSFDVRVLKYGANALTSCSLEYSAYER